MFAAIGRFFASLSRLADHIDALGATAAEANHRLRSQLQLDGPAEKPLLIDATAGDAEADAAPARNGRRAKATA